MRSGIDCRGKEWEEFDMTESKATNLTGQKFGMLTVKFRVNNNKNKDVLWLNDCDCGNQIVTRGSSLKNGHTTSCGCAQRHIVSEKLTRPFQIGEQVGYWTILARAVGHIGKGAYWHCKCKCGEERDIPAEHLRNGASLSCGCLQKEIISERQLIDLTGQQFGLLTVICRADKKVVGDVYWTCRCNCGNMPDISGHSLRRGSALSCGCLNMSHGEYHILNICHENNIRYVYNRAYFPDLKNSDGNVLRYDFVLIDDNKQPYRIIEFDGKQHNSPVDFFGGLDGFQKTQLHDEIKNAYALSHNIPLVRLPYTIKNTITLEDLLGDKYLI